MINCQDFFEILYKRGLTFFTGIPDSTFKDWMTYLSENDNIKLQNIIPCNECEAIALAAGYNLATDNVGIVYMQNSGFGKAVNPITSLCDPDVYSIPILLMIGWRGKPDKLDAPQHKKMGKITLPLLETLGIPYRILKPENGMIESEIDKAIVYFKEKKGPYAFIIESNFFNEYNVKKNQIEVYDLTREKAIEIIMGNINDELIISSTGFLSRELFEYRESHKKDHFKSFYNIGSMGCACSIALSIALQKPNKRIIVFDGDGSIIMQMGAFSTIGKYSPLNFVHIVFDNHSHESTGGQPTNSSNINLNQIALACKYKNAIIIRDKKQLEENISKIKFEAGPILIVIKIKKGSKKELERPSKSPKEYKEEFMKNLTNST